MSKDITIILLGAGNSRRFKSKTIKQNYKIHKKRVIDYSREFFNSYFHDSQKYIVANDKVTIISKNENEHIVKGSSTRLKSLYNCLKYIYRHERQTKFTLIHDIARPILNLSDISKIIKEMKKNIDGSTLGYPITNAVKEVKTGFIENNILRDNLWITFTPQIFKTSKLNESIQNCLDNDYIIDDDIEALMLNNLKCSMVISSPANIKITYISDIKDIERIL